MNAEKTILKAADVMTVLSGDNAGSVDILVDLPDGKTGLISLSAKQLETAVMIAPLIRKAAA